MTKPTAMCHCGDTTRLSKRVIEAGLAPCLEGHRFGWSYEFVWVPVVAKVKDEVPRDMLTIEQLWTWRHECVNTVSARTGWKAADIYTQRRELGAEYSQNGTPRKLPCVVCEQACEVVELEPDGVCVGCEVTRETREAA